MRQESNESFDPDGIGGGQPKSNLTGSAGVFSTLGRHLEDSRRDNCGDGWRGSSYAASDGTPEKVRLTQFALEPAAAVFFVQHNGWNEIEYNRDLQRRWRWTTNRAETFINSSGRDVTLTMAGESPLKYFDAPPHVVVRAGQAVLATADLAGDFELVVKVPAAALAAADGMVTIETDKTFVPNERSGSPDKRRLGLRLFKFDVQ